MSPTDSSDGRVPLARILPAHATAARARWQLEWRGNSIELPREGALVIGRSPRCDVVIDHSQISRTHCRLVVHEGLLTVEDLKSCNGSYINGERLVGSRELADGDLLLLGAEQIVIGSSGHVPVPVKHGATPRTPETPPRDDPDSPAAWRRHTPGADARIVTTRKADAFATLGTLADRMFASGRFEAAAKILSGHMKSVLGAVRDGRGLPEEVIAGSVRYALKLAAARSEPSWLDYVIDLHLALRRILPADAVEQIRSSLLRGATLDLELLARYKLVVRALALESANIDRAAVDSILMLDPASDPR